MESPVNVLKHDFGVLAREPDVAGKRQFQPAGDAIAVDGGDDWFVNVQVARDAPESRPVCDGVPEGSCGLLKIVKRIGFQVGAGAKGVVSGACQDSHAQARIVAEFLPGSDQFIICGEIQRIHGRRTVECDYRDVIMSVKADGCHTIPFALSDI